MEIKVSVTFEHITKGMAANGYSCPINLALKSHFPKVKVVVWSKFVEIAEQRYDFPEKVVQWVADFDDHKFVEPFEFTLALSAA